MSIRKIMITSAALLTLLLFYVFPSEREYKLDLTSKETVEYVNDQKNTHEVYLLDTNGLIGRTTVPVSSDQSIERKTRELVEAMIIDGPRQSKIPNGFKPFLPHNTKILGINFEEGILKIDFSKDLLDIKKEYEEKMVEAITFSLTSMKDVKKVLIFVEGDLLKRLPKTNVKLPTSLDRTFGINKEYDIKVMKDINDVTVYYANKHNDDIYYVPVTKYFNGEEEKIQVIVDQLSAELIYEPNLMSYLNNKAKLLSSNIEDRKLILDFNEYIFNDAEKESILEEVVYSIALSVKDNYDVDEVIFRVNDKEVARQTLSELK